MDDSLAPEVRVLCSDCGDDLSIAAGASLEDVLWLHQRRCRGQAATLCQACDRVVTVNPGFTAHESLWLHENDCPEWSVALGYSG